MKSATKNSKELSTSKRTRTKSYLANNNNNSSRSKTPRNKTPKNKELINCS